MPERHYRREDVIVAFRKWLRNYNSGDWGRLTGPERELVLNYHTKHFTHKLPEPITFAKKVKNKLKERIGRW